MKNNHLTLLVILLFLPFLIHAQEEFKVNSDELVGDLQISKSTDDQFQLVWWIPPTFWEVSVGQDPSVSEEEKDILLEMVGQKPIFAVLDADINAFGMFTYPDEDDVRKSIKVIDYQGNTYLPIPKEEINSDTDMLLSMMGPMLSNMMGDMGKHFYFFVFPEILDSNTALNEPNTETAFTFYLNEESFDWKLPLPAMMPPKYCPVDNQKLNGTYKFCPFHGKKLD